MASELIESAEPQSEPIATRQAYGDALVALGENHEEVVALDADLAVSTQSMKFGKQFPERFFNVGAAEANMMSISCGLAASGKVPYASTFAIFATSRSYDQVRLGIAHNELKVRIGASHGGVSLGEDGASHQMIEDIALMRAMPRMPGNPYIFPSPITGRPCPSLHFPWTRVRERAGLENLRLHDLRHSFASFLVNKGVSLYVVQGLLGHTQPRMTQRYAHLAQNTLAEAVDLLPAALGESSPALAVA